MSKESEKQFIESQAHQEAGSVFDFLYHDPQRIGSFLSQMDSGGLLKGVKLSNTVNDSHSDTAGGQVAGDTLVLKGKASSSSTLTTASVETGENTYDPLWTNARAFLDYLAQRNLINRHLNDASIGQFVLVTGNLTVLDFIMLRGMWKLPSMQHFIKKENSPVSDAIPTGNRKERRAQNSHYKSTTEAKPEPTEIDLALELMDVLPHSIQGRMWTDQGEMWTTLNETCLVTTPSDILLKHGLQLPGEWSMLGILDAYPYDASDLVIPSANGEMSDVLPAFLSILSPLTRGMLGRPEGSHAMTPLLIFREVKAA